MVREAGLSLIEKLRNIIERNEGLEVQEMYNRIECPLKETLQGMEK